jgi:hypothetical protein
MTVDTNGVSMGYPKWITTYANDLTSGRAGVGETVGTVAGTDLAMTVNTDGVSILYPKWITTADATAGLFPAANSSALALVSHSHGNPSLNLAGGLSGATASNSAGFTLSLTQAAAAPSPINFSAGTTTSAVSGLTFSNSNNMSFGLGTGASAGVVTGSFSVTAPYLLTAALSDHSHGNPTLALTNLGGTTASASNGFTLSLNNTDDHVYAWELEGNNTAGTTGTTFTTRGAIFLSGGNNVTLSGNSNTIVISAGAGGGGDGTMYGGYTNLPWWTGTVTLGYIQSTSHVVPFVVQANISFDFVRFMQVGAIIAASTTAATTGAATFSCGYTKTYNLGIFSRQAGANSDSLGLVKSTGFTEQFSNNIACAANSTQFSYSNRWTLPCSSGALGFTYDYSSSVAGSINVNTAGAATGITGTKWIDIPFGTSLTPGQYWLMYGASTTTAVQSAGTTIGLRNYVTANPVFASQAAISFGTFGAATSNIYAPQQAVGSFTTAGGATTNSLHWSKVTASAANPQLFFALMRSA